MDYFTKTVKLVLVLLTSLTQASGFQIGGGLYYISSDVLTNYVVTTGELKTTEKRHHAITGLGQGIHVGYHYDITNLFSLGAELNLITTEAEEIEERGVAGAITRIVDIQMNSAIYPTIHFGVSPTHETTIRLKAGYGSETWSSERTDAPLDKLSNHSEKGTLLGAEITSQLSNKVLLGLGIMQSDINHFIVKNDSITNTCELCHSPSTTSVSAKIHYQPSGNSS